MSELPIRQAATLIVLRDGSRGLETLLLRRSDNLVFASGAWVFPGGRVDDADCVQANGVPEHAARLAAVRETQEEAAVQVDSEALVYFAHWTTPVGAPKRYATWFFASVVQPATAVTVDGSEIDSFRWIAPADALRAHQKGELPMMPPTFITLQQLAQSRTAAQALDAFAARQPEVYEPKMIVCDDEVCFLYPGDSGYVAEIVDAPEPHHRFWMGQNSRYIRS
ncbi:MAG TPA: NUDIX hydrolase [Pseudomonadales bacterium]|jgi:8-oxo-dGTP pyrophosphatase MutT (NUDIX family)